MKSDYNILGLNENATADEIKKAYRRLAMKYHPDINTSAPPEIFLEIKEAYYNLTIHKTSEKTNHSEDEKVFSRRYNRWLSQQELDNLLRKSQKLRQKKEETEKQEALRDFEELQKSWVYKGFPFVAIFGIIFSVFMLLDFHLNHSLKPVKHIQSRKIHYMESGIVVALNPQYVVTEVITEDFNRRRHSSKFKGNFDALFNRNSNIELMQTPIFKIDLGYKTQGILFFDGSKKKAFHYPLAVFSIFLIGMTILFKNPTPFYYVLLNSAVIGIPILSLIFLLSAFLG